MAPGVKFSRPDGRDDDSRFDGEQADAYKRDAHPRINDNARFRTRSRMSMTFAADTRSRPLNGHP
jgi:hypothetical protein